jgi:hypothetical protein
MRTKQRIRIGVFHKEKLNRCGLVKLLSEKYDCEEIENWEDVEKSTANTLVLVAPEMLYPEVSFEEMIKVIENHRANIILINYDAKNWWIHRLKYVQLRKPSLNKLLEKLEMLHSPIRLRQLIFRNRVRA